MDRIRPVMWGKDGEGGPGGALLSRVLVAGHGSKARGGPCLHPGTIIPAHEAVTMRTPCAPLGLDDPRTGPIHRWVSRELRSTGKYRGQADTVDIKECQERDGMAWPSRSPETVLCFIL